MMKSEYKSINYVQTHLITWGNPFDCNGQDVIVCITGNPGIVDYYIEFGSELYESTSLPVCVIGHAGHEEVPDINSNILKGQEHLFNLKGQVEHKLDFIKNYIDKDSKVHIIGHSIGAWMIIELIDKNDVLRQKVITTNLLFPTIQKMAESKSGVFLNKVLRPLHCFIILFLYLLSLLPNILFEFLITCYIKLHGLPSHYFERIKKFFCCNVVEKVLFLAYDEMDNVVKLNVEGIKKLSLQTYVIYSAIDNWVPENYIDDIKSINPFVELKKVDISHAFVLKSAERVAGIVSDNIRIKILSDKNKHSNFVHFICS